MFSAAFGVVTMIAMGAATGCRSADERKRAWPTAISGLAITGSEDTVDSLRIVLGPAIFRVGDPKPSEIEELGWVREGVVLDDGSAVVPDLIKQRVIAIAASGKVSILAGRGEGPGEVSSPSTLYSNGPQSVDIIDNALRRVSRYEVLAGVPKLVGSKQTSSQPSGACAAGTGYWAMQFDPLRGTILTKYQTPSESVRSIGNPVFDGSALANEVLNQGRVICSPTLGSVVYASALGDLVSYSAEGRVLWRRRVSGFQPMKIEDRIETFEFNEIPDSAVTASLMRTLVPLSGTLALVQFAVYERGSKEAPDRLKLLRISSRIVDLISGREMGSQEDLPRVLSVRLGWSLATGEEPQPWVQLHHLQLRRSQP